MKKLSYESVLKYARKELGAYIHIAKIDKKLARSICEYLEKSKLKRIFTIKKINYEHKKIYNKLKREGFYPF